MSTSSLAEMSVEGVFLPPGQVVGDGELFGPRVVATACSVWVWVLGVGEGDRRAGGQLPLRMPVMAGKWQTLWKRHRHSSSLKP